MAYYVVGALLLWVFTAGVYGDVFRHLGEENFVCADSEAMNYVLRRPWGYVVWGGRYLLLPLLDRWAGGTWLALWLTAQAWLLESLLPRRWRRVGLGWLIPLALLAGCAWAGFDLYLRTEPALFILSVVGVALLLAALHAGAALWRRFRPPVATDVRPLGRPVRAVCLALPVLLYGGLTAFALTQRDNVRLSCRMQNQMLDEDWDAMIETARTAKRPCRTVAALHAVALERTDRLLEGAFALRYDYPKLKLRNVGGSDEGVNYLPDFTLHGGLVTPAYHLTMENHVVLGPRLHNLKRMALCALLNGERRLAERYLNLVDRMPFCHAFVERYRPLLNDDALIASDPMLSGIRRLRPQIDAFEQSFRQPTVLGYNLATPRGTDATLVTSVAAALYAKELDAFLMRVQALRGKVTFPPTVLQAIMIASVSRPGVLEAFPEVNALTQSEFQAFAQDAAPFLQGRSSMTPEQVERSRRDMADALCERWLGTYMYYYYCGNLEPQEQQKAGDGVN